MQLVLSWRRAPETWLALASTVQSLAHVDWAVAEQACPAQVPLSALMNELNQSIGEWEKARHGTGARDSAEGP
jgi:hypothetical protein